MTQDEEVQQKLQDRQDEADKELGEALKAIFKKPIQNLTAADKAFLQARRSYLDDTILRKYDKVLSEKLPRPDGTEEEEVLEEMARKDLEIMGTRLGIEDVSKKAFPKNEDLVNAIKKIQEEEEKKKE